MTETGNADIINKRASGKILSGVVKVSTGVLKLVKLFAGDASNHKSKYKR